MDSRQPPGRVTEPESFNGTNQEKIISIAILILLFATLWYLLDVVLLTFILSFVFYHFNRVVQGGLGKLSRFRVPDGLLYSVYYVLFITGLGLLSYAYMPRIVSQIVDIGNLFITFDIKSLKGVLSEQIYNAAIGLDFGEILRKAGQLLVGGITNVSIFGFSLFLSLILSYLILIEQKRIRQFGESLGNSRLSFFYTYFIYFGSNFLKTFGQVMRVQVTIALINTVVSMLLLSILGFPAILGLGIMIFGLGLIPVAGVTISLIPLSLIAFNLGGLPKVLAVVLLIVGIHMLEADILNPKLMSRKTRLPICFVFIVLLVAEHYLGVWGLLIGIPIFIFLLTILDVRLTTEKA